MIEKGTTLKILLFDEPSIVTNVKHGNPAIDVVPYSTKYHNKPLKSQYEVYSPVNGKVVNIGYQPNKGGYFITIQKSNKVQIFLCHFADTLTNRFKIGDSVSRGQYLAIMGSTGHSTGPHVHIQGTKNGQFLSRELLVSELSSSSVWMRLTMITLISIIFVATAIMIMGKNKPKKRIR